MKILLWNWWTCCPCSFLKLQKKTTIYTCQQGMNP